MHLLRPTQEVEACIVFDFTKCGQYHLCLHAYMIRQRLLPLVLPGGHGLRIHS